MDYSNTWSIIPQQISSLCSQFNDLYLKRKCRLDSLQIIMGTLKLKAGMNESYQSVFLDWERPPAGSSFCVARRKIPASAFSQVRNEILEAWESESPLDHSWKGYNLYAIDGSTLNLPTNLVSEGFHLAPTNYLPQGLLSTLFCVNNRTIHDLDFSSNMCEREAALRLSENLGRGDVLIFDKGYLSFGLLCELKNRSVDLLCTVQEGQSFKVIEEFRNSTATEAVVTIDPSEETYRRAEKKHPGVELAVHKLRLIKFPYNGEVHVIATTLPETIPASEIIEVYLKRWRIEELYKVFKTTLSIEEFHSKSTNGVEQELHASSILWNLSRKVTAYVPEDLFKKRPSLLKYIALPA